MTERPTRTAASRRPVTPTQPGGSGRTGGPPADEERRLPRPPPAALLAIVVGLLAVIGLMMVLSASSVWAIQADVATWMYFQRHLMWLAGGTAALAAAAFVDYRFWRRLAGPAIVVCFVLLLVVHLPGVGVSAWGSSRWIGVGPITIQPSELAKLAALLFTADLLDRRAERIDEPGAVLRPLLVAVGVLAVLTLIQPDMGTTMLILFITITMLFVGGLRLSRMAALGAAMGAGAIVTAKLAPYRWARVMAFLNPGKDPSNTGYQVTQSLVALGTGHLTGVGLGASRAKWGFLPNAHTDFIFAIIGEELGLLGTAFVVSLFVAFGVLGVTVAMRAPDRFGMLLAAGVTAWVVAQALVNMGGVTGALPITGVPLPFVSFGGTSLLVTMAAVGILVNVARQSRETRADGGPRRRRSAGSNGSARTNGAAGRTGRSGRPTGAGRTGRVGA